MMITGRSSCELANTPGRWPLRPSQGRAGLLRAEMLALHKDPPLSLVNLGLLLTPASAEQEEKQSRQPGAMERAWLPQRAGGTPWVLSGSETAFPGTWD